MAGHGSRRAVAAGAIGPGQWVHYLTVPCPVCGEPAAVPRILRNRLPVVEQESDGRLACAGMEPAYYAVAVCGRCTYAAPGDHFPKLDPEDAGRLRERVAGAQPALDWQGERSREQAILAVRLALYWAEQRNRGPVWGTLGSLYQTLAWIHRYSGDAALESDALYKAAQAFQQALVAGEQPLERESPFARRYRVAELYRRAGHPARALVWFRLALAEPSAAQAPEQAELARQQLALLRATDPWPASLPPG